jgi:hypothetical protein
MTDDFPARVRTLLAALPRVCEFGCNTMELDRATRSYVPKTRDGFNGISDAQVERFRQLCNFIDWNFSPAKRGYYGSYGLKHVIEREKWCDDNNRYVSNGEGIVAMILCGYKPYWSDDQSNPNCTFKVNVWGQFKDGQAFAKKIWRHRVVHSLQWLQMEQAEENWQLDGVGGEPDCEMWKRGYAERAEELKKEMVYCGACMPSARWGTEITRAPCKSKHAGPVIFSQYW